MAERTTTTDTVFARLREDIVAGRLPAGSQHSIYRLADEIGVSRTPVREAVLRLADVGLVTIERNRGVRIRGVTARDVREVFELRLMLEVPAAARAAAHADEALVAALDACLLAMHMSAADGDEAAYTRHDRELHSLLAGAWGNAHLTAEIDRLRDSIQVRGASTIGHSRTMTDIAQEHAPIVEAVRARDREAAAACMREHLVRTATLLMRQVAPGENVDPRWADHLMQ